MQSIIASAAVIVMAVSSHVSVVQPASELSDASEVYVAQMDGDWNVTREIRVPCSIDIGCSVDLGLAAPGAARLRVRFEGLRGGKVVVASDWLDAAGHAIAQPEVSIGIDRTGFGAQQFEPRAQAANVAFPGGDGKPLILMAVKMPGWAASLSHAAAVRDERT